VSTALLPVVILRVFGLEGKILGGGRSNWPQITVVKNHLAPLPVTSHNQQNYYDF
jgi:hypothetical protein